MANPQLACQTITWGNAYLMSHYEEVLQEVRRAGYNGVETNLGVLQHWQASLPSWSAQYQLRIVAGHVSGPRVWELASENAQEALAGLRRLGAQFLLISSSPEFHDEDYRRLAEAAAKLADIGANEGIRVLYHHHNWELRNQADVLTRVLEAARARIGIASDFGWVMRSELSLDRYFAQFGDAIRYVHLKDSLNEKWVEMGRGTLPLQELIQRLRALDLPWWTLEQDSTDLTPFESVKANRDYVQRLLQETQ
ncbi:MAG: sugar phosphate isomerase/epimerase [Firmicutes bacterium]|nr:sugar phosphate isomerase/epimerase [Bacillota bacterium]